MKYLCTGRIHPERADVSFSRVKMQREDGGTAVASCDASQITVYLDYPSLDGWIAAQIVADEMANIIVGAVGFSLGSGYSVEMLQVTEEDGTPHVFGVRPTGASPEETLAVEPFDKILNEAIRLSGSDVFFRLALRDYRRAITDVTDCATYCYRAIESIKSAFTHQSGRDSWDEMHSALQTDRQEIESTVKIYADPIRHGNWINAKPTNKFQRWNMLTLTRKVLLNYLQHRRPGS
jgi:hypothetical protein